MTSNRSTVTWFVIALALGTPLHGAAQVSVGGSAEAEADIESGANSTGSVEGSADDDDDDDTDEDRDDPEPVSVGGGDGIRLGLQGRIDAINLVGLADPDDFVEQRRLFVPIVTPGVRLLDDNALFLGLGLGFSGASSEDADGDEESRSGWSLSPLASYDVLRDDVAALALLGWINLASLGESEVCDGGGGGCTDANNDAFGWGLSLGAGVRGLLSEGLAIGAEFGWSFLDISPDAGGSVFVHGLFGNIVFEASVGLD
jgi:hypothetical protein